VTEYVLVELGSALARSRYRGRYVPLVEHLLADADTDFVPASKSLFRRGLELFAARADKTWSLVDCLSFMVMKQRRLRDALSTDEHFNQAGFRALLREGGPRRSAVAIARTAWRERLPSGHDRFDHLPGRDGEPFVAAVVGEG